MLNRAFYVQSTRCQLCGSFILLGCIFILMALTPCVQAQDGANDPVVGVEATNVTVWRDAISTGLVTITCHDKDGNAVPNAPVSISIDSDGSVSPTSGTTDNNGNITVTVKSTDFAAVGNNAIADLTATSAGISGTSTVLFRGPLQIIDGDQNGADVTNKTTTCNVGERHYLEVSTLSGVTITNAYWTASGATPISNWSPGPAGSASVQTSFPGSDGSQMQVTLYLTTTGSDTVTLSATDAAASATANTYFTVSKPNDFTFSAKQNVPVPGIDVLALGVYGTTKNKSDPGGIYFTGSGGAGGALSFGQILHSMNLVYTAKNGIIQTIQPKATTDGVDSGFPYPSDAPGSGKTNDNPSSNNQGVNTADLYYKNFSATMYLMWTSNKPNSIPIPVESVPWSFYAEATYNSATSAGALVPAHCSPAIQNIPGTPVNQGTLNWSVTWNPPHA